MVVKYLQVEQVIYVPFKVSQINVKGIDLDFDANFRIMYFVSNLVDYGPLGSGYAGIFCDNSTSTKQLTYLFKDPRDNNESYTFTYTILEPIAFYFANGFVPGTGPENVIKQLATTGSPSGRVILF